VREIDLPGLGTAGYLWQHDLDGDTGAVEVVLRHAPASDHELTAAAGASAREIATIRALRPGTVRLRLVQRRPWEAEPLHRHDIEVHITPPRPSEESP